MSRVRVNDILEAHTGDFDVSKLVWDDYDPKDTNVEFIDGYLGNEGGGEDTWAVYKIVDLDKIYHIMFTGYFNSWNGTDWDEDFKFVEPYEVLVTKFKSIKEPT